MAKKLLFPSNLNIKDTLPYVDGYIYGLKGMSVEFPYDLKLEELKQIVNFCKENKKELFISLNKNIYSQELDNLKDILKELDKYNLNGILFADTCFVELKNKLNLKTPLVWSQEHLTTNYQTINEWFNYGVEFTYLSSDITLREILEIKENSKSKLMVPFFGYFPIFTSKRYMINNYLKHFNLKDNSNIHYLLKEEKKYPILETKEGTVMYTPSILNGYYDIDKLNKLDYITINSIFIDDNEMINILKKINNNEKIDVDNQYTGFLHQETIYKVK